MLLDHTAKGVYAIAVTPFKPDGAVDYDSVDRMTDFYLGCGVTGLTILGIMGEAPKLDPAEALAISNQVVRRAGVPIIVGVSAPGFAAMRSLDVCSHIHALHLGAHGRERAFRVETGDLHQAIGLIVRKRAEQNAVHQAENSGVGADAESKRQDRDEGKAGVFA